MMAARTAWHTPRLVAFASGGEAGASWKYYAPGEICKTWHGNEFCAFEDQDNEVEGES